MNRHRSLAALRALCDAGLHAEVLVPTVLELLHDVVPSSRNLFDWTDEQGELLRYFIEGPVDEAIARHYFDEFHNRREAEVMAPFAQLRCAPAGVRSAAELDHAGFFNSALYQEIWRPQGFRYRLEGVLRGARGQLLGSLVLYRDTGERCFSRAEEAQFAAVLPHVTRAMEGAGKRLLDTRYVSHRMGPQTLLLTPNGQVQHATPGARRLLMLAQGGITRERLEQPLHQLAGQRLQCLLDTLQRQAHGGHAHQTAHQATHHAAPQVTHENPWGLFTMSAAALRAQHPSQAPLVQVMLTWGEPHRAALERALRLLPLTAGQLAVCRELYQGKGQAAIAEQLGVATATVVDHVRKLYRALDVRSTLELRTAVDAVIHLPMRGLATHS